MSVYLFWRRELRVFFFSRIILPSIFGPRIRFGCPGSRMVDITYRTPRSI